MVWFLFSLFKGGTTDEEKLTVDMIENCVSIQLMALKDQKVYFCLNLAY